MPCGELALARAIPPIARPGRTLPVRGSTVSRHKLYAIDKCNLVSHDVEMVRLVPQSLARPTRFISRVPRVDAARARNC